MRLAIQAGSCMLSQGIYTLFYRSQVWGESELHFEPVEFKVPMRYSGRDSQLPSRCRGLELRHAFESSVYNGWLIQSSCKVTQGEVTWWYFSNCGPWVTCVQTPQRPPKDADSSGRTPSPLTQESLEMAPWNLHFKWTFSEI